jgi:hypothetical protein
MDDTQNTRWTLRRFTSLNAMKAEEYAYWQSRPIHERLDAGAELSAQGYAATDPASHVSRLRTVAHRLKH